MTSFLRAVLRTLTFGSNVKMNPHNVVFISGCDSGLGHSLAVFCHSLNMTVISACHNPHSDGARLLQSLNDPKRMITLELDLLKPEAIADAGRFVAELLRTNSDYQLTALVNNAGVMLFGEFEWQTSEQFEMQINVNLLGTMRLTKELLPLVRQHRGRIINITSHCALQALPFFAPYTASKAGVRYWNDALRVEMQQYGVEVINFIPGSFVLQSNIATRQPFYAQAMFEAFSEEQRLFYGDYQARFNAYVNVLADKRAPDAFHDGLLLKKFQHALTNSKPKAMYIHEPWRYKFYRLLFRIVPTSIADWLTVQFCSLPRYQQSLN